MIDLWYKNAVIYCLDVETFQDGNGDGIGDFKGLTARLSYLETLGVTCIWLLPFQPSPNRDNGYDIADFYGIDPRYGTLGDFVTFVREARDRGIRILIDLVVNHTSVDHPWFQSARSDPSSPFRDWYVWSKEKPDNAHHGVVFPGVQDAIWDYDEQAKAWYMHRFYDHQADLNVGNPEVREEICKIMGFWLQVGVQGFRIDAVPFLIEHHGLEAPPAVDPISYLREFRRFLSWRCAEAVMLAEANIPFETAHDYFGDGNRIQMIFNFPMNQRTFLAFVRGDSEPIRRTLQEMPEISIENQWASFLRNHDELDLGRLAPAERTQVFDAFAPDEDMRIYDRGIRRRLASMFDGNVGRLKMAFSLMFSLPGTPVFWYGDEIGMGDDQSLDERHPVRTPMQWSAEHNGGFSSAARDCTVRPPIKGGKFGYERLNVTAQERDPDSLLTYCEQLIQIRRSTPEIGWGEHLLVDTGHASVLGLQFTWNGERVVIFNNLSDARRTLAYAPAAGHLVPIFDDSGEPKGLTAKLPIRLGPYGFAWYRLRDD